ncbi:hypothetical protein GPECTOR_1g661 [Gonium pectorale]|uniref:Uncharacterized protein n=1 Tax=Gonium pectorale TaxID=33097 RepID=A0A150H3V2_GONPE|nr:hypothetical protein GPECTOR_1g661 [Gonium pectorale]|eukprot:KXZ56734.1 hypothetical protein GPECTOR_1g661 [Gonium pectorale]
MSDGLEKRAQGKDPGDPRAVHEFKAGLLSDEGLRAAMRAQGKEPGDPRAVYEFKGQLRGGRLLDEGLREATRAQGKDPGDPRAVHVFKGQLRGASEYMLTFDAVCPARHLTTGAM